MLNVELANGAKIVALDITVGLSGAVDGFVLAERVDAYEKYVIWNVGALASDDKLFCSNGYYFKHLLDALSYYNLRRGYCKAPTA